MSGMYEEVTFKENSGKILLETSKATCTIGGSDCTSTDKHGQTADCSAQNTNNANKNGKAN